MSVDERFLDSLWDKTLEAVAKGNRSILIWGFTPECLSLLRRMEESGFDALVSGIVDPRRNIQGVQVGKIKVYDPAAISSMSVDTLIIAEDRDKEFALSEFARVDNRKPEVVMAGQRHLEFKDTQFDEIYSSCMVSSRAAGYRDMLVHIYQSLVYIANQGLTGDLAEFGVYKAGTTVFLAKTIQKLQMKAKIFAFDTFGGFPERKSVLDLYSDSHDEFVDFEAVSAYTKSYPIELVKGDICNTYRKIEGIPLVFSFFDTDNFTPTNAALEMCYEQTVPGGILAFDHIYCDERWLYTVGERIAAIGFLKGRNVFNLHGTGIFIKR